MTGRKASALAAVLTGAVFALSGCGGSSGSSSELSPADSDRPSVQTITEAAYSQPVTDVTTLSPADSDKPSAEVTTAEPTSETQPPAEEVPLDKLTVTGKGNEGLFMCIYFSDGSVCIDGIFTPSPDTVNVRIPEAENDHKVRAVEVSALEMGYVSVSWPGVEEVSVPENMKFINIFI